MSKKPKIYDISNVDLSYSYIKTSSHNPLIEYNDVTRHRAAIGYNYATQPKYIEPFKKMLSKKKSRWLDADPAILISIIFLRRSASGQTYSGSLA